MTGTAWLSSDPGRARKDRSRLPTDDVDEHELRDFRTVIQARVGTVSRLAADLAGAAGLGLDQVASALRPSPGACWSTRGQGQPALEGLLARTWELYRDLRRDSSVPGALDAELRRLCRAAAIGGVQARASADEAGGLAFFVRGSTLEAMAWLGPALVHTSAGVAHMHLSRALPDAVALALEGRDVADVLAHPALRRRGYRIRRVASDAHAGCSVIGFRTGVLGLRMPWADLLPGGAARC